MNQTTTKIDPKNETVEEEIEITYGGTAKKEIAHIQLDKITSIPENPKAYPEFSMFGELPAWGFYLRHAEGIKIKGMKLRYVDDDFRPALVLDDVKGSEFDGVEVLTAKGIPVVVLNRSEVVLKGLKMPVGEEMGVMRSGYE